MDEIDWTTVQTKIVDYFSLTFQVRPDGLGGWGRLRGQPISIVNTAEALLALQKVGDLGSCLRDSQMAAIKKLLCTFAVDSMKQEVAVTRYLAYSAIGLAIIGEHELKKQSTERLLAVARDGGWPIASDQEDSFLTPTFHAMFALTHLGEAVDHRHYDWLRGHQRSDSLCSFRRGDPEASFGASCLVLYLLVKGGYEDRAYTRDLALAVRSQLNNVFSLMLEPTEDWVSVDPQTNFKIYGYGLGLQALHELGMLDPGTISFPSFMRATSVSVSASSEDHQKSIALACDPRRTWVPAVLELAIALYTIKDSFDPFMFYHELDQGAHIESEYLSKRAMVERELRLLELKKKVVDAQERELIKRENLFEQLDTYKGNLSQYISGAIETSLKQVLKRYVINFLAMTVATIFLTLGAVYIYCRFTNSEFGSAIADVVGTIAVVASVVVALLRFRKR